jgi:3-hydroxyisobutyrate dehydrogenase
VTNTAETTIAFIGTGVMGRSMAGHLLDAGYALRVHNRTREKAEPLVQRGAVWADTPGDAADGADVVITIVGYPADVEEVYLGDGGIIERASSGAVLVDMTTSSPQLAEKIYSAAARRGLSALDAPVSGGDVGARNAALTIMVGGDSDAFEKVRPVLDVMGASVILQGDAGAGQHTKMANQIAIAGAMLAMVECLSYAKGVGLDPASVLESVKAGSAGSWSLNNLAPRVLSQDFAPGFYVKHFVKDLRIALDAAEQTGMTLPGLSLAKQLYERLLEADGGELGTQALWLLYADAQARADHGVRVSASV